jgi:glutaminyl-peptide cyclotransferase
VLLVAGALAIALALLAAIIMLLRPRGVRDSAGEVGAASVYGYKIVHAYPHDPEAFTQGLIYRDGSLFESTGLSGRSTLREVRLETGEVVREYALAQVYFGEGLTNWGDTLVQLTWQSKTGFLYDEASFKVLGTFRYGGEGWGLTHDARQLIMSDGSASLRFLDPVTFEEIGRLEVQDRGLPVNFLNELELVKGEVYANVWQTDRIAMISPGTGRVDGWIDLGGLRQETGATKPIDVLNGIAYDAAGDRLFVTGKLWPKLFEIKLVPRP